MRAFFIQVFQAKVLARSPRFMRERLKNNRTLRVLSERFFTHGFLFVHTVYHIFQAFATPRAHFRHLAQNQNRFFATCTNAKLCKKYENGCHIQTQRVLNATAQSFHF